jgi:hypothetical protein
VWCSVYTALSRVSCRPPKCLTCPCYLRGQTPCIGIITVLSNLEPFDVEGRQKLTVSAWLEGGSLLRPEIFQNRWRTDKDPTKELTQYAAIVKQPLSSGVAAGESHAVLEQDLETQFSSDMLALKSLDQFSKQHALRQLKSIMGKFSSTVSKFVMDSRLMKTSQGRGAGRSDASLIAKKTASTLKANPMYPVTGASASSLACGRGYGKGVPVAARRRPGNNLHIPDEEKWTCPLCKTSVKKCSQSIQQHKESQAHRKLQAKMHYCEACDIYCENTPDAIRQHNDSFDHGHQRRMDADSQRDGKTCAENRRRQNNGQVQSATNKKKQKENE